MLKKGLILASLWGLWASFLGAQEPMPISRVLLYKNGMAYIIRTGTISEPVRLSFHPEDMKDILKTFSAWNPQSGDLYPVGYTTGIPLEESLRRFPFTLSNSSGGLAHFLAQIQGARLEVQAGTRTLQGKLAAIHQQQHAVEPETLVNDHVLSILVDQGSLQTVWLSEASSLRLLNPELNRQLETYLGIVAEGRQDVTREITVYPGGGGSIQMAYLQQFPVWKTSYRVEVSENWIQGWAQVDNPTGEAWTNVDLTLISGMPVSFIMDLYAPLYTSRTTVPVPGGQVAAPRYYEAPVRTQRPEAAEAEVARDELRRSLQASKAAEGVLGGVIGGVPRAAALPPGGGGFDQAEQAQVQDYFEYRFPFAVELASRQSALLPFLRKKISLEKISIFNPSSDKNHPLSGAWLENDSGVPLEPGPVTFFAQGRYAGEAVLDYVSRGERRLVSYGVDFDIDVVTERKAEPETTVHITVNRGTIVFKKEQVQTTQYQLKNKAQQEKIVLIEHPRQPGRELKEVKPVETTENFFRFRVSLKPGEEKEFPVAEIVSRQTALSIRELDRRQLEVHFAGARIPPELRQRLQEIVAARERIASLQEQVQTLRQEIDSIFKDQTRVRENLRALGRSEEEQQLRSRYLSELNRQEDQLGRLNVRVQTLTGQIAEQEQALSQMIQDWSLSLDL